MNQAIIEQKKKVVEEILEKIEKAQSMVLVDYRGLNVEEVSDLRNKYREAGVEYKVYKNNMMKLAFKEAGLEDFNEFLKGPSAVAFSMEDAVSAAKVTNEFAKANDKLEIKAGIVDGDIIDVEGVKALASIPSREVLIAKVLGGLNAPIAGFANVLQGNMRGLVCALNQIAEQKEA